jgi:prephenate dehydrogenase
MRIAVLGTGHMGGWFSHEFSKNHEVAVYDINRQKTEQLNGARLLTDLSDLRDFRPELLLNAVTLKYTTAVFVEAVPYLPGDCLIADIASIKGDIPDFYGRHPFPFVSLHPMFGPHFADLNQLQDKNAIIITESDPGGKDFFRQFFKFYNLHIFEHTFAEHDEIMAESLGLPFATSIVFAAAASGYTVPGTTFSRQKDIAGKLLREENSLLCEVLFNPATLQVLENVSQNYEVLRQLIESRDYTAAGKLFAALRKKLE